MQDQELLWWGWNTTGTFVFFMQLLGLPWVLRIHFSASLMDVLWPGGLGQGSGCVYPWVWLLHQLTRPASAEFHQQHTLTTNTHKNPHIQSFNKGEPSFVLFTLKMIACITSDIQGVFVREVANSLCVIH